MGLLLTSERVVLRDVILDDCAAIHAYAAQPEVSRFQPWGPNTPDESRAYVEFVLAQAQAQPRTNYTLAIVLTATTQVIGTCSLVIQSQHDRQGELGYVLHPAYWGRGYATEVARRLLHFGFTTLGLHRISATCDPRNTASVHVLDKVGMQYEGRLRDVMLLRDGWRDSLVYSLLEHEWQHGHR